MTKRKKNALGGPVICEPPVLSPQWGFPEERPKTKKNSHKCGNWGGSISEVLKGRQGGEGELYSKVEKEDQKKKKLLM